MAAIKRFFEKKKLDVKFKKAGEGHRLEEDSSCRSKIEEASSVAQARPQTSRTGPTSESRRAGEAALSRIESQQSGPQLGTSSATIKAQVKRELEAERKMIEKALAEADVFSGPKEMYTESTPLTSTIGIYFKCPMAGPASLPKDQIDGYIHDFLMTHLPEEPEMTSALMIYTLNKDKDKVKACVDILCKYLDNMISKPDEPKFRKVRLSNKVFTEKVAPLQGTSEFMQAVGFERKMVPGPHEIEEEYMVLADEKAKDTERLESLKDILLNAEAIKPELDRNLRVFSASPNKASQMEVSDEFYNITREEAKREQQRRQEAAERLGMLRTKEMREREQLKERRRYRYTVIRIRFPDGILLQGTFKATETLTDIMDYVRENLELDWMPFHLSTQTGQRLTEGEESTIAELGLAPAAVVNFSWDPTVLKEIAGQQGSFDHSVFLKQHVLAQIQSL